MEYIINEYLTLKLEGTKTMIYVNGRRFRQCKYLAFNIPLGKVEEYDSIKSIDDMEQRDRSEGFHNLQIDPEQEFWGHCSNLQAWVENGYDTRLLHRNLAFPLLRELTRVGDPTAGKIFKEEILSRVDEGNETVIKYLSLEGYLSIFTKEDIESKKNMNKYPRGILTLLGLQNRAPKSFYDKLFDWKILRITAGEMDYYTIQTSPKNEKGNPLSGINGGMYQKVDENCIPVNCACTEKPDSWG